MALLGSKLRNKKGNSYTKPSLSYSKPSLGNGNRGGLASQSSQTGQRLRTVFMWLLSIGIGAFCVLMVGVLVLQAHRYATTSDFFATTAIEIRGTTYLTRAEILQDAGLAPGINSLTVNIADIEQGIRKNPWVAEVTVKRRLPDSFEIKVRERIPAFWILQNGVLHYADNKGRAIAPLSIGNFVSLPTLEILPGGEELLPQLDELARAFQNAKFPVDMAAVSMFRLSGAKGFEVFIENRNLVLCLSPEDWELNLRRLSLVLADLARRNELKMAKEVWASNGYVWVVVNLPEANETLK